MSVAQIQLDAEGRLDLDGLDAPFGPGDVVEFFIAGDQLVLKQCPAAECRGCNDRRTDPPGAGPNSPHR